MSDFGIKLPGLDLGNSKKPNMTDGQKADLASTDASMAQIQKFQMYMNLLNLKHKTRMTAFEAQKNAAQQIRA